MTPAVINLAINIIHIVAQVLNLELYDMRHLK